MFSYQAVALSGSAAKPATSARGRSTSISVSASTGTCWDRPVEANGDPARSIPVETTARLTTDPQDEVGAEACTDQAPPHLFVDSAIGTYTFATIAADRKSTRLNSSHVSISYA